VEDRSHTAHRLQTTLTPAQEAVVVALRQTLWLPLDDLLVVTREFICAQATRSGLHRLLKRRGLSRLPAEAKTQTPANLFQAYAPGYLHLYVKYLPPLADETERRYLFVAIDRATCWVFLHLAPAKSAAAAKGFLAALQRACPIRITRILTDNGVEFTDRLFGSRAREPSGNHEFDRLCQALGIEHRLTKPRTPQTNGRVERFNGRSADILKTHHFSPAAKTSAPPWCATHGSTTTTCPRGRSLIARPSK
jgi:transposase InsO family protein